MSSKVEKAAWSFVAAAAMGYMGWQDAQTAEAMKKEMPPIQQKYIDVVQNSSNFKGFLMAAFLLNGVVGGVGALRDRRRTIVTPADPTDAPPPSQMLG